MPGSSKPPKIKRRQFLAGAAAAPVVAAVALGPNSATAAQNPSVPAIPNTAGDTQPPGEAAPMAPGHVCGSDHMVDVLRALDLEYIASNPASTFRSLQESIVNYGGNTKPEFLTALHEDSSVHFAQGYAKITGKPMAAFWPKTKTHAVLSGAVPISRAEGMFCPLPPSGLCRSSDRL